MSLSDGDGVPDVLLGPPPMDPMGRMQWQAMMGQRQQMARAAQVRRARRKEINNQVILAHLRAYDPLFPQVHEKVQAYVRSLPRRLQNPVLRAVEETPGAYLDLYKEMRDLLMVTMRIGGRRIGNVSRDPREAVHIILGLIACFTFMNTDKTYDLKTNQELVSFLMQKASAIHDSDLREEVLDDLRPLLLQ